jgi:PTH1 family peptidyl-tRNA hydrolase
MILIVGLGNPGKKYEKTRHNVGFMTVEGLKLKVESFSDWRNIGKLQAKISEGEISSQRVILVKPQTFMNESGKSVKSLTKQYALTANNLIVIHDDLDLPLGKIRISVGIGSAGHKGVESIIRELGTKDFVRFRIGIKPLKTVREQETEKFVLKKFDKPEEKILKEAIEKTIEAVETTIKEGVEKAMSRFNK